MSHSLNIVSFDVPFPANYGGVIDVYYKLYWLHRAGVKIHLHCFTYGRKPAPELERLCEKVYYYERRTGLLSNLSFLPYTVVSRRSEQLEKNLLSNNYPILFEVLHTCYLLNDERLAGRKKIYRHSNIEHEYYRELARSERNFIKKNFLKIEARKLERFENIINSANLILAVNQRDTEYFLKKYPGVRSVYLPSFHPGENASVKESKGNYVLFHGNLSISENYEAAVWLIENVFSKIDLPVVVAGLEPPAFLAAICEKHKNIALAANPTNERMSELLREAQVHVLYTSQPTGLKLKLLNVLFAGRFVVLNRHMLSGTGLENNDTVGVVESPQEFINKIKELFEKDFSPVYMEQRKKMTTHFNNELNAAKLISEVFT